METKINIAKILKNKPEGTKLWTDMFGSVTLYVVTDACDAFQVKHHNKEPWFDEDGKLYKEGVLCIYPSKSMRDWEKFSWKKGDVLVSNDSDSHIIFKGFSKDDYTTFEGKHWISVSKKRHISCLNMQNTQNYHIEDNKEFAQTYINTIEERLGGKLNRETLEVEKPQPEFKDGDIVFMKGFKGGYFANCIFILRSEYKDGDEGAYYYAFYNADDKFTIAEYGYTRVHYSLRLATDSEKQQLFDALAKKGKRWDIEKKQIVDLKLKWTPKPFDKVVVRCGKADKWSIDFFSYKVSNGYICTGDAWFGYCLPYNEETAHLLGTTDDWEGGEQ
jgi:hypothetical protein